MKSLLKVSALVAVAWMLSPQPANAAFVVSVTGDGTLIAPPASAAPGVLEADAFSIWEESSGSIAADLALDHDGTPGDYKGNDDLSSFATTLSAGTKYNSTFVHLDPASQGLGSAKAVITFTSKIIGIAAFGAAVDATDALYGAPGTTYPTGTIPTVGLDTRGIDYRANDKFSISLDGKVLTLHFTGNGDGFDQFRVFTSGVPEPASLAVWSLIGVSAGGGSWLRRRRKGSANATA